MQSLMYGNFAFWVAIAVAIVVIIIIFKTAVVVPQQQAFVVESLGKYSRTLRAGFHILIPFIERALPTSHSLKELALRYPRAESVSPMTMFRLASTACSICRCIDPERASYGIIRLCAFAISQLAQTTLRSEIGKIAIWTALSKSAAMINANVVSELDKASDPWGVKVLRYEIKNINPPHDVLSAMEKQMRAEREKRAVILTSEGVNVMPRSTRPRVRSSASSRSPRPPSSSRSTRPRVKLQAIFEVASGDCQGFDTWSRNPW